MIGTTDTPGTAAAFSADPLPALLRWAAEPDPPPVRLLEPGQLLVSDAGLLRQVLTSTVEPFQAHSAPFGAIPGWAPGAAENRAVSTAMIHELDAVLDAVSAPTIRAAAAELSGSQLPWPVWASQLYLRTFGAALLPDRRVLDRIDVRLRLSAQQDRDDGRWVALRRRIAISRTDAALHRRAATRRHAPDGPFERALLHRFDSDDDAAFALHGLVGGMCRAAATALSWTVLLDRGWSLGTPAGAVLRDAHAAAPAADRVREALRLWPTAWLLHRGVRTPGPLAGVPLEAGDDVYPCLFLMHRDARVWAEPHAYRPERWSSPPVGYRDGYLPYGTGPAACIGARFVAAAAERVLDALPDLPAMRVLDAGPVLGALASPPRFVPVG